VGVEVVDFDLVAARVDGMPGNASGVVAGWWRLLVSAVVRFGVVVCW